MSDDVKLLVEKARLLKMSPQEREAQRQSFAYGNTSLENPDITKDTVREQAEALNRTSE